MAKATKVYDEWVEVGGQRYEVRLTGARVFLKNPKDPPGKGSLYSERRRYKAEFVYRREVKAWLGQARLQDHGWGAHPTVVLRAEDGAKVVKASPKLQAVFDELLKAFDLQQLREAAANVRQERNEKRTKVLSHITKAWQEACSQEGTLDVERVRNLSVSYYRASLRPLEDWDDVPQLKYAYGDAGKIRDAYLASWVGEGGNDG